MHTMREEKCSCAALHLALRSWLYLTQRPNHTRFLADQTTAIALVLRELETLQTKQDAQKPSCKLRPGIQRCMHPH